MKLFIIALKGIEHPTMPQCAKDAVECARLFSGAEVVPIGDFGELGWIDAEQYMTRASEFRNGFNTLCGKEHRMVHSILRWFIIDEYVKRHSITEPIAQIDWEVLVFENLEAHFNRFIGPEIDLGDSMDKDAPEPNNRTAPAWIGNHSALRFFTYFMESHLRCRTPLFASVPSGSDMTWWRHTREAGGFNSVALSVERGNALFDANIILDLDIYESQDGAKRVYWQSGKPHFKRRSDGTFIRAVALHCFWTWKDNTSDILKKATSGYSD